MCVYLFIWGRLSPSIMSSRCLVSCWQDAQQEARYEPSRDHVAMRDARASVWPKRCASCQHDSLSLQSLRAREHCDAHSREDLYKDSGLGHRSFDGDTVNTVVTAEVLAAMAVFGPAVGVRATVVGERVTVVEVIADDVGCSAQAIPATDIEQISFLQQAGSLL